MLPEKRLALVLMNSDPPIVNSSRIKLSLWFLLISSSIVPSFIKFASNMRVPNKLLTEPGFILPLLKNSEELKTPVL